MRCAAASCRVCLRLTRANADDTVEERALWLRECDYTHQLWGKDDASIAAYINALGLNVLIDLIGRIPHNHHAVLAYRPAPVQIVAIYAATTASPFVDYFITDTVASTPELSHLFSESLIMMPISHFVNNQRSLAPAPLNSRYAAGSCSSGGCAAALNAFYKMDPVRARSWWRVLNAVSGSSIMFVKYLYWKTAQRSILSHAQEHNISHDRVTFVEKLPSFDLHLQAAPLSSLHCHSPAHAPSSCVTVCCSACGTVPSFSTATS
jgi:predicted O-linked N-acetylglucosamine transferase (SPINDLY family)